MKVHLYFNATIAGHVDIDNLMPDIINRFLDNDEINIGGNILRVEIL